MVGPAMIDPEMFDYTRRNFWGGPCYPYWTLVTFTVLGGFFGLDHFWLRSPTTGVLKCIVNIFTFGLWWMYDMLQIFGEKDTVMKHGLTAPLVGPLGIGAGMFTDNQEGVPTSKSPLRWMAYLLLMMSPFGFDFLVAGDSNGAFAKFLSIVNPFLWPISFVWFFLTIGYTVLYPKQLFTTGLLRFFPFTLFMDSKGPSVLGPKDMPDRSDGCDPGGSSGFFRGIFDKIIEFINKVLPPIIITAINSAFPGLVPAVQAGSAAVQAGATAVKTGFNVATGIIEAARDPATVAVATGSQLLKEIPGAVKDAAGAADIISSGLNAYASPDALKKVAVQSGGAMLVGAAAASAAGHNSDVTNSAILALLLVILTGGSWFAAKRLNLAELIIPKRTDDGQQRDDTPPRPRDV